MSLIVSDIFYESDLDTAWHGKFYAKPPICLLTFRLMNIEEGILSLTPVRPRNEYFSHDLNNSLIVGRVCDCVGMVDGRGRGGN